MQTPTKNDFINKFVNLFEQGYEAWIHAGKVVVEALEEDPDFADKVHDKHPEISVDTVYAFDRLGRKQLHPKLLISDSPGAKKLRRLPYSVQEKYVNSPVPLLIKTANGWETLPVNIFNMTPEQVAQAFDSDSIRSDGSQRAWLENRASKALITVDEPYRISGRKLIVMQPCQFSVKQLVRLLSEIEG